MAKDHKEDYIDELTPQQIKAVSKIVAMDVTGDTYQDVADSIGINITTLYNWRKKNAFRKELNKQAQAIADSYLTEAFKTVNEIMNDPKAQKRDRLEASKIILRNQGADKQNHSLEIETEPSMGDLLNRLDNL